jgi:hypothetical protein
MFVLLWLKIPPAVSPSPHLLASSVLAVLIGPLGLLLAAALCCNYTADGLCSLRHVRTQTHQFRFVFFPERQRPFFHFGDF